MPGGGQPSLGRAPVEGQDAPALAPLPEQAPFSGVAAQTPPGFSTVPVEGRDPASKLVLILAMAVGGDMGSTAGGIKIFRLLVILKMVQHLFARTALPRHAVVDVRVAGRALESPEIALALVMVSLFAAVAVLSRLPFLIAGYDPLDALFEVVSALGTVGLSSGVSGPELPPLLKGVLCLDMLAGRLDILAFLVLFFPPTWRARPAAPSPAQPGRQGAADRPAATGGGEAP